MYIDISYPIDGRMAIYPGNPVLSVEQVTDVEKGDPSTISRVVIGSHTGTHIDAPAHFILGGITLDQIPLEKMNGRAKVIDVTSHSDIDVDLLRDIDIKEDDRLLFKTDNSLNWNCDCILDDYVTLTYDAAEYLSDMRINLVGIDYLTVERPRGKRLPGKSIHKALLGNNVLICEALKLRNVKPGEYWFWCLPLKLSGIDGCPVRAVLGHEQ